MTMTLTTKPRRRTKWTAAERAEWLSLFEKSGQAAAQFCRDNDLSTSTLSYWLRRHHQPLASSEEALIELPREVVSAATGAESPMASGAAAGLTMQLPGGVRLEIVAGTDPAWLAQVLRMLPAGRP